MSILTVKALDIKRWADEINATYQLPELVRRLIFATAPTLQSIDIPIGESVNSGGWDGITTVLTETPYIPAGVSGWEMGKTPGVKGKADSDYAERIGNALGLDPKETTFVFVTPRAWTVKKKWITDKKKDNHWKDVRVLNADDLEAWLSLAPAVQLWFAGLLGKRPAGLFELDTYWQDWTEATVPATPSQLVLAGRNRTSAAVHEWLSSATPTFTLQADSRDEALAVFTASLMQLPVDERDRYLAKAVVVTSLEAWRQIIDFGTQLLLIPIFEDRDEIAGAIRRRHRVFIPSSPTDTVSPGTEPIPRISREAAERALQAQGISHTEAYHLAWTARSSFASFRRKLALLPSLQRPVWAKPENAFGLVPALLVGAWDENSDNDREAIAQLAQLPYEQVQQALLRWANEANPPVRLTGSTWYVNDKLDIWSLLHRFITSDQLNRFYQLVDAVLGTPLPRFELPVEEQYRADLLDRHSPYSSELRDSLANTLALMGSSDTQPLVAANTTAGAFASTTVVMLLRKAIGNPSLLLSISNLLPALAEAAPDSFLKEISTGLSGENPVVMRLFNETPGLFHSTSHHDGLLWALEILAWKPDYLAYAITILTKLAQLDPGGSSVNRPINTLREIFLFWYPNTAAPLEQRIQLLKQLIEQAPEIGDTLLLSLLPKHRGVSQGTVKPSWRNWPSEIRVLRSETQRGYDEVARMLIARAGADVGRWQTLITTLIETASGTVFTEAVQKLSHLSSQITSEKEKSIIWHTLRKLVHQHRSFPSAEWTMWGEQTDELAGLMPAFESADIVERYAWLFDQWPALPEGREEDDYESRIEKAQVDAMQVIRTHGDNQVISLIPLVPSAYHLGFAFAKTGLPDSRIEELLVGFLALSPVEDSFARGLVSHWLLDKDRDWSEAVAERLKGVWNAPQLAEWFTFLVRDSRTWQKISEYDKTVQNQYWEQFSIWGIDENDAELAVRLLLEFNQPVKAVELLGLHERKNSGTTTLILEVLEKLNQELTPELARDLKNYHVTTLLEALAKDESVPRDKVAQLEFGFLPITFYYHTGTTTVLHKLLATNPLFFTELLSKIFRAEGEERLVIDAQDAGAYMSYHRLLESFRIIPGLDENNQIDQNFLFEWVASAKQALNEAGRGIVGEQQIGQLLSGSPIGNDKQWPHEAVRNLLEHAASTEMETGFEIGLTNSRGSTTRGVYEGGVQERNLVNLYSGYATAVAPVWPRTGAILRSLAEYYRRMADYEDGEADRNQDLRR